MLALLDNLAVLEDDDFVGSEDRREAVGNQDTRNAYTTYSKLFGYKKSTRFVMIMTLVDLCTNIILVFNLNKISLVVLVLLAAWMTWKFVQFMQKPTRFKLVEKVERYTYLQEATMLITVVVFLLVGKI